MVSNDLLVKWRRYVRLEVNQYSSTTTCPHAQAQHIDLMKMLPASCIDVLDLGCGDGWSTNELRRLGKTAIGITVNDAEAKFAFKTYGIGSVVCDMHDLIFNDHSFDAIYCRECYEHSVAPYIAMCEMNRVLRSNGYALINIPGDNWIREDSHYSVLTQAQMLEMFYKCKFKVINDGRTIDGHYWYLGQKIDEI